MTANNEERSDRSRRIKGAIAGLAGASLLLGGTFALWSDSDSVVAGTIVNGNLDVTSVDGEGSYWDISADRSDASGQAPVTGLAGHRIANLADWSMVPGDTVQATYLYTVELAGDNLVADLGASLEAADTSSAAVTFTAQAYLWDADQSAWTAAGSPEVVTPGATPTAVTIARVQAANQADGVLDAGVPVLAEGAISPDDGGNVAVVVRATLPASVEDRVGATETSPLSTVTLTADQVRP